MHILSPPPPASSWGLAGIFSFQFVPRCVSLPRGGRRGIRKRMEGRRVCKSDSCPPAERGNFFFGGGGRGRTIHQASPQGTRKGFHSANFLVEQGKASGHQEEGVTCSHLPNYAKYATKSAVEEGLPHAPHTVLQCGNRRIMLNAQAQLN